MTTLTPGGEVTMHPGPKVRSEGIKPEHGPHDVKKGFGGHEVVIQGGSPELIKGAPLGQHNTDVKDFPGNSVVMHPSPNMQQAENAESLLSDEVELTPEEAQYAELLAQVSGHTVESLHDIANNMDLSIPKGIDKDEIVNLVTDAIYASQKEAEKGDEG